LGPSSNSEAQVRKLITAGANGFRLNFSHGNHEEHAALIRLTRDLSREMEKPICIVQDLQGPKLRTRRNSGGARIQLTPGRRISLSPTEGESTPERIHVKYDALALDLNSGDRILLDDGQIELKVLSKTSEEVNAVVVHGGELGERKGINLPGVRLSTPALTDKDEQDLAFGLRHAVDMVAMSFVSRSEDVTRLRERIREDRQQDLSPPVISKLERQEAIDNLQGILDVSDGVMVARGDLGVEVAAERVPSLQKRIIDQANGESRLVITATQMLESMIRNPRPTRAESSDVANAVFDGSDVLMLSGETAVGSYPIDSIETMHRIIRDAEMHSRDWGYIPEHGQRAKADDAAATTQAARDLAHDRDACAIVVFTRSGRTALLMSKARPEMPILGLTPESLTYNRMALFWGVDPHLIPMATSVEEMIGHTEEALLESGKVRKGDRVVLVASLPVGAMGPANMSYLHTIGQSAEAAERLPPRTK
jgi:pyruvate kinase